MSGIVIGLYVAAYLLAVFDGIMAERGNFPADPGRTGTRRYWREHPWIFLGAACGVAATILAYA